MKLESNNNLSNKWGQSLNLSLFICVMGDIITGFPESSFLSQCLWTHFANYTLLSINREYVSVYRDDHPKQFTKKELPPGLLQTKGCPVLLGDPQPNERENASADESATNHSPLPTHLSLQLKGGSITIGSFIIITVVVSSFLCWLPGLRSP